jgi:hypothetical protein
MFCKGKTESRYCFTVSKTRKLRFKQVKNYCILLNIEGISFIETAGSQTRVYISPTWNDNLKRMSDSGLEAWLKWQSIYLWRP